MTFEQHTARLERDRQAQRRENLKLMLEPVPESRLRIFPSSGMPRGQPSGSSSAVLEEVCDRFRHIGGDISAESGNLADQ